MSLLHAYCVMLANGRQAMVDRAIRCFNSQTHKKRELLIYDTGPDFELQLPPSAVRVRDAADGRSIGALRNFANSAAERADIIAHWDSDDWSAPDRLETQIATLQRTNKRATGYNAMPFWDSRGIGEAWCYRNTDPQYVLGTSLCYWRSAWEGCNFDATSDGEYREFLRRNPPAAESAITYNARPPLMIASIHSGNVSPWYRREIMLASEKQGGEWKRVPEWDDEIRKVTALPSTWKGIECRR